MENNANLILGVLGLVSIPLLLAAWLVWVSAAHAVSISNDRSDPDVATGAYDELADVHETLGDDEEDDHGYTCICETCIQNHPERDIFYGDGDYYDWESDTDKDTDDDLPSADGEPRRVDDSLIAWLLFMPPLPTHTGSGSPAELLLAIHERREADREADGDE